MPEATDQPPRTRFTVRFNGQRSGVLDNTVRGILGNHHADIVKGPEPSGERVTDNELLCEVASDKWGALREQLEANSHEGAQIDVNKGEPEDSPRPLQTPVMKEVVKDPDHGE